MRLVLWVCAAAIAGNAPAVARLRVPPPEPGVYTNEEEVYFDVLAKRPAAPWVSIKLGNADGVTARGIDAFQRTVGDIYSASQIAPVGKDRIILTLSGGKVTELRRARLATCWVAIRKDKPKADGGEDWYFESGVKLHDQGGRALVGGGDTGAQPVMIRIRNVTWDVGSTNAPVVSLYIHKPDNWDKAESYSWAAPDSARVGINLRWVQTGCTIEGLGKPSKPDTRKFKTNGEAKAK